MLTVVVYDIPRRGWTAKRVASEIRSCLEWHSLKVEVAFPDADERRET